MGVAILFDVALGAVIGTGLATLVALIPVAVGHIITVWGNH